MTRKVFSLLLLLHLRFSPCRGRGCTTSSPGYDPEVPDYSGVSPIEEPPTRIGSAILYKCPGVKTFKGEESWQLVCQEDESFQFNPVMTVWPECQCELDMKKTDCKDGNYTTVYQNDPGDRAGATLILPLPKKATDFTVSMEMDTAVSSMSPLTSSNANALVTDENKLRLVPSSGADMDADSIRIDVEFDLKTTSAQPRYRHPCVVKISCEFESADDDGWSTKLMWIFLACVGVGLILIMCFCFLFCYCVKNYGVANKAAVDNMPDTDFY